MSKSIREITRHPARFGALAAIAIAVAMLALFTAGTDTQAVHNEGLLELDGNTVLNTGGLGANPGSGNCPFVFENGAPVDCISTPATYDWNDVCTNTAGTNFIKKNLSFVGESSCTQDFAILSATGDNTYHTGSDKDYQDISGAEPVWHCSDIANATNKADLLNAYAVVASKTESGVAHEILYFGAERASENGTVFNGFWFLQDTVSVPNDCPGSTNFTGKHTCGDVLILFNYDNGGRIGKIGAWNWQPGLLGCDGVTGGTGLNADCPNPTAADTHDPLCLIRVAGSGDCRVENPQGLLGDLCGRVNGATNCVVTPPHEKTPTLDQDPPPCSGPGAINTPWAPGCASGTNCTGALASPTFSEGGVDLTGLGVPLPCVSTFVAETRSSDSVTATLKDFSIGPFGVTCTSGIATDIHSGSSSATEPPPHPVLTDCTPTCGPTGTVTGGTTVHDAAFLSIAGPSGTAGGTLTFRLYTTLAACNADTDFTGGTLAGTRTVSQTIGGPTVRYESDDHTTSAGDTELAYKAKYSGAGPIPGSTAGCEPLNVINPSMAFDKDAAPVATVTYTYQLSNTGDVELNTVTVTDDKCSPAFVSGDTDGDSKLDTTEVWNYACSTPISLTSGVALTNTARANAKDPLGNSLAEKVDVVTTTATLTVSDPNGE